MLLSLAVLFGAITAPDSVDPVLAARYFQEAKWISEDDGGKLWGQGLYGPMIFVDPQTRAAATNEAPSADGFRAENGVFIGRLPEGIGIANYGLTWGGRRWTMVMWPLPENRAERATLMMHELFHRIQPALGFPGSSPKNAHLDEFDGRLWLQVEFAALARALAADDPVERDLSAADALLFRAKRQRTFPGSKTEEDALELNEGLAQFTGYMLRGGWEPEGRKWMANQLRQMGNKPNYTRTFGYWTGAAYAFLLNVGESAKIDEIRWRKALKPDSSLAGAYTVLANVDAAAALSQVVERAKGYGYDAIFAQEESLREQRRARQAEIRQRFLEEPSLVLPLEKMNISFDFRAIVTMGADGTFYGIATLINEWGTLAVTEGVLVSADFKTARVPAPKSEAGRKGPGWELTLKEGWRLVPGPRKGDFVLTR